MATLTISLDQKALEAARRKAGALGIAPEEYARRVLELDAIDDRSLDDLLDPLRRGFDDMTEQQVDDFISDIHRPGHAAT
jgi:hypothetical protein